jgi:hypothetical protein
VVRVTFPLSFRACVAEDRYPRCQKWPPHGEIEGQVLHALQGHKIVAGGNAPGTRDVRSPTLKGSNPGGVTRVLRPGDHANSTLSGSDLVGDTYSGGVAPGYCIDPLRGSRMDSAEDVLAVVRKKG